MLISQIIVFQFNKYFIKYIEPRNMQIKPSLPTYSLTSLKVNNQNKSFFQSASLKALPSLISSCIKVKLKV